MKVETQYKGEKKYYYLKHSFRSNGEVKTKRMYLGNKEPQNIDMLKAKFYREIYKDLFEKLDSIKKKFISEWKKLPKSAIEREIYEIAIAFTYNTNAIEGSTITLPETREIILHKFAPAKAIKDIEETKNHAELFLIIFKKRQKLSNTLIANWHKEIFKSTKPDIAGKFRNYFVRVGNYMAPHPEDMRDMLNEFDMFIKTDHLHPVEFSARIHYLFEKIHPFGDGNGRIGRLIMNHILWTNGYPMIIIEYKNRNSYYKALEKDEQGFVDYFIKLYLKAHRKRYLDTRNITK